MEEHGIEMNAQFGNTERRRNAYKYDIVHFIPTMSGFA